MISKLQNKNIIIISPETWGLNHLSKHHYANELSYLGSKVWFITPPNRKKYLTKTKKGQNLTVLSYKPIIRGKNNLPEKISQYFHKREITKLLTITGKPDIIWSFDPYRFQWLKDFGAEITIYHTVDKHPNARRENIIAQNADFIFSPADGLISHLRSVNNKCFKIPHGLSIPKKQKFQNNDIELPGKNKIKACYVGNFYKILDFELITELINQNTDVDFIFIGPKSKSNLGPISEEASGLFRMEQLSHVFFLDSLSSNILNKYLDMVDICFIAYKNLELNSHKIMHYLYSGSVCISTPIEEYMNCKVSLLQIASTRKGYLEKFEEIKNNLDEYNHPEEKEKRRRFALLNSYSELIKKIEQIITSK
jgi:hypothetical protein